MAHTRFRGFAEVTSASISTSVQGRRLLLQVPPGVRSIPPRWFTEQDTGKSCRVTLKLAEVFASIKGTGKFDGRYVCVVAAEAAFSSYRTEMPWLALLFAEHAQGELDSVSCLACRDVQGQAQCLRQGQAHSLYFSAYWTPPCQSHSPLPTRPRCESS